MRGRYVLTEWYCKGCRAWVPIGEACKAGGTQDQWRETSSEKSSPPVSSEADNAREVNP